jgi:hypothetical protein
VRPLKVDDLVVEEVSVMNLSIVGLLVASSYRHHGDLLWRNDDERQRFLYQDDGKRVFPRRKFVEVNFERDDFFSGHWI